MSATAKAVEHYGGMAAEAMSSRRATDERTKRIALLRRGIAVLVQANALADQARVRGIVVAEAADALFEAEMNVERLLGELA